jgi:hypothetical protein
MSTTQNAAPWPAGVTHRYLTIVGATVDLRGGRQERCRALPRPTGSAA